MKKHFYIWLCIIFSFLSYNTSSMAMSIIRDTEIEEILMSYIQPIFKAGGLDPDNAQVVIVNDPEINAFVSGGQTIFVHTGLLLKTKSPDELVFVLAHETGHIIGGHVVRGYQTLKQIQSTTLISTVLGGLVAIAGQRGDAGIAVMMGGQTSALGLFAQYRQGEESTADRIAANILLKIGYSLRGFEGIMKTIIQSEKLNENADFSYLRTHPLTKERLSFLNRFIKEAPAIHHETKFDIMQAKLGAFLLSQNEINKKYTGNSIVDSYAQSISKYKAHKFKESLTILDHLISQDPQNPFFHELKGQFLLEIGHIEESIQSYQTANQLHPKSLLIKRAFAQALLESDQVKHHQNAEKILKFLSDINPEDPMTWYLLSKAYSKNNHPNHAEYAIVEFQASLGKTQQAISKAQKIIKKFPKNSKIYQKLQDIIHI